MPLINVWYIIYILCIHNIWCLSSHITNYIEIDEQVSNHTNTIKSKFKEIHESLNERESILIEKLNKIANEKKEKLLNTSKTLKQQQIDAQKVMFFYLWVYVY